MKLYDIPLRSAAYAGNIEKVRLFIERGDDINSTNEYDKRTPLYMASKKGHIDAVRLLLEHGAKHHTESGKSRRPIFAAKYYNHPDVVEVLMEYGDDLNI